MLEGKIVNSGVRLPEVDPQLCHLLTRYLWMSYINPLSLGFLICNVEIKTEYFSGDCLGPVTGNEKPSINVNFYNCIT